MSRFPSGPHPACAICAVHHDASSRGQYEIARGRLWLLRHHPDPAPLPGWLLLDSCRHLAGPADFTPLEAQAWGPAVRWASALVRELTACDRVYAIAFGEGAPHLHLHLIPRFAQDPQTAAWSVADHYRAVAAGGRAAAPSQQVADLVARARDHLKQGQGVLDGPAHA
ncbi:diadenosine tetraphosphate hydrolase [Cyanobium sp. FACHB-13342]|uniref:HIT family protein n=1 Tax=Cyanobium sp. FACHB-13342 TaxID=2692793 RepID=UPI0016806940|nr:diadenosine tetraphosphate hydrolase [Cyanobium sp. FACHB-13342]MBD2423361.1 diadenosine tetraphosphate hydrolase [Cyanobium sp. FACHB-13342]